MKPNKFLATLVYSALPIFALVQMAPEWRHSPPKPEVEESASVAPTRRPVREARELMRVVSYSPPIEEATKTIRNPNDPDDPGHLELVEGRPGSAVLEGPFEIEVILPEDCDFDKVRNSVGSKVMIDTRYWVTSKTETDLQGRTIQSNEANMGVFMPTARQTLCNWEGKPLPTIKQSSPKDKVVEDTGEADRDETGQTGDAERAN